MTDARLQEIRDQNQYLRRIGRQRVMQEELLQALDESTETERLRCRRIAEACHDAGSGYKPGSRDARIYHDGIATVVHALQVYADREQQRLARLGLIGAGITEPGKGHHA